MIAFRRFVILTSFQKTEEAKFFLTLINVYFQEEDKCDYCISAFLHACYDLLDQILEEYQVHFHLGIPANKTLTLVLFVDYAKKNHNDAIEVAKIYASEMFKLITNPIGAAMLLTRNINTHRTTFLSTYCTLTDDTIDNRYFLPPLVESRFKQDLRSFIESRLNKLNEALKSLGLSEKALTIEEFDKIIEISCEELSGNDIRKVCLVYFRLLERFVNAIRIKYSRR